MKTSTASATAATVVALMILLLPFADNFPGFVLSQVVLWYFCSSNLPFYLNRKDRTKKSETSISAAYLCLSLSVIRISSELSGFSADLMTGSSYSETAVQAACYLVRLITVLGFVFFVRYLGTRISDPETTGTRVR